MENGVDGQVSQNVLHHVDQQEGRQEVEHAFPLHMAATHAMEMERRKNPAIQ
jgi:hypothetical protein